MHRGRRWGNLGQKGHFNLLIFMSSPQKKLNKKKKSAVSWKKLQVKQTENLKLNLRHWASSYNNLQASGKVPLCVSSLGQSVNIQYEEHISSWVEGRRKVKASSWFSAVWFTVCTEFVKSAYWSQRSDVITMSVRWCHGVSHSSFPFFLSPVCKWRL